MAIAFTQEQEKVIQLRDRNILVSAAAGSGKTAVLVERIVRMVCDESKPVDIDKLLIVTFTNAAAAEMRERIDIGIAEKLQENPDSEHIQKQSTLLHNAQITTIDSFCLYILRNHFHEIGLDPAFRVADENEIKLLEKDVLEALLEEKFAEKSPEFLECVAFFCSDGKINALENHIQNLSGQAASCAFPEEWLRQHRNDYDCGQEQKLLTEEMEQYLFKYLQSLLRGLYQMLDSAVKVCELPGGPYMYGETIEKERDAMDPLLGANTFQRMAALMGAITFGSLPACRDKSVEPNLKDWAKQLRDEVKKRIDSVRKKYFGFSEETLRQHAQICNEALRTLLDLTLEFDERVLAQKAEKKIIDFSDMEHYALQILLDRDGDSVKPSKVAEEYRSYFYEILVDEYQDSNFTQEALLEAISGEKISHYNRFMVGDIKQSIYGFRQARPDLFLHKYDTYEVDGESCCRIDLSKNYRSRKEVVDSVNGIFERIMSREIGGLSYDENARLYAQADYVESSGNESELLLVETPGNDEELNGKQAEALAIAQKIKELKKNFLVMDKATKTLRPVRYSDMVILLRSLSGWAEEFKRVMEQEGIPLYVTSKTGYFAACEVQELLQMLRVLDNPRQDVPLFGVLKSVLGGFSKQEIAEIRAKHKEGSLYEALCKCEEEKAVAFLKKLNRYREYTVYMPIRELLERIVEEHDYLNYVTALPAGSKRRANVEMLYTKASDFEKTSYFGLFHFVRYMEQLEKYEVDYGEADFMDEKADVVRLMTIHKSKGLEFPVTFVSGLGKKFNEMDLNRFMVVDADFGIGIPYVDVSARVKGDTLRRQVLIQKKREDMLAEELRVLYVALTRAREKLILTATMKDVETQLAKAEENASEHLEYFDFVSAKSYLDFLMPILKKTDLKVQLVDQIALEEESVKEQLYLAKCQTMLEQLEALDEEQEKGAAVQALAEQVSFQYPHRNLEKLYTKTSVSELKAEAMAEKDEAAHEEFESRAKTVYIPSFGREQEEVSGVLRGSAFHRGMELLDFEKVFAPIFENFPNTYETYVEKVQQSEGELRKILTQFFAEEAESLRLQKEYYSLISIPKVITFLKQECAYRMWRADRKGQLFKEQPFVLGIDATQLQKRFEGNAPEGESVLIQGIIDVFWIEEDKVILLDYKTDRVPETAELWKRYETQVDYYTQALHRIVGKEVTEKILYSTCLETACIR